MCFHKEGDTIHSIGSNAKITVTTNIRMENQEGFCIIELPQKGQLYSANEITFGKNSVFPTTNGVAIKMYIKDHSKASVIMHVDRPFMNIRANDRCFALMSDKFRPFLTLSCIGTMDASGRLIAPAQIHYQKVSDKTFCLTVSSTSPLGQYVLFEENLYENKLLEDTTVESMNPSINNAFGTTGFIGSSLLYGEQWLYSRLDVSKLKELTDKQILRAVLHLPTYNSSPIALSAYKVSSRFCSFGSNWKNKVAGGGVVCDALQVAEYESIDLTPLVVDQRTTMIKKTEGIILSAKEKSGGFVAISTGDSCFRPQILEIDYR